MSLKPEGARPGLAVSVTATFAAVAAISIALNGLVSWQLNGLVVREERASASRMAVAMAARNIVAAESDIAGLVHDTGVHAAVTLSLDGHVVRTAGVVPEKIDASHTDVAAALRGGVSRVKRVDVKGHPPLLRVATPIGPPTSPRGALVAWLDPLGDPATESRARRLAIVYAILNGSVIAAFGWYLVTRAVVRPISRLSEATRRVTGGEFGVRVRAEGTGEIASLARDFNGMTEALAKKVSELENVNESLRAARIEVTNAEKLASVGRLAAGVAHELGNPVAAVTGYVGLLQRAPSGAGREDVLERMEKELKRIDRIIRDLLEYSRPRAPVDEVLDVDKLVEDSLVILEGQGAFNGARLVRTLGKPAAVRGDPHRLSQVLVNLLINASDAVKDSPEKRIEIATYDTTFPEPAPGEPRRRSEDAPPPTGPAVGLRVTDSGAGLSIDQKEKLFEPFFTTKQKGTGLGLAISRAIVESMGGRIRVDGAPGKGASFELLLPVVTRGS